MSRVSSKHNGDPALDFQGFLSDLHEWETSVKDKDQKMKAQTSQKGKTTMQRSSDYSRSAAYQNLRSFDAMSSRPTNFTSEETSVDSTSEKELGNEYFKQKKYNEAIDCYSRSIALSPTAVAYANRAMAYLKIKRFREAEDDCTEALNLDDRYIKAYSRRATARKGLGKLKESMEDAELALRLEPQNSEVKKQFAEIKSLLEKAIFQKASRASRSSAQGLKTGENKVDSIGHTTAIHPISSINKKAVEDVVSGKVSIKEAANSGEMENGNEREEREARGQDIGGSDGAAATDSSLTHNRHSKKELGPSVQELASRAAARAMAEAAKNISPPNSAYQFEVSWKGFHGDRSLQARLLKVTPPDALPQIFKNALSAPVLIEIIKCIASFFSEETQLAIKYLENLTKVSRFDMLIMCLPSADKADIGKMWDEVFLSNATPIEFAEVLSELHPRYCPRQ